MIEAPGTEAAQSVLEQVLGPAAQARQAILGAALHRYCDGTVAEGPFRGLKLLDASSWAVGDLGAKLIGQYEAELHDALEAAIAARPPAVVNVGCAEGYYAVGLARRLPGAVVFAFDSDAGSREICRATAALNGVEAQVVVEGTCTTARLLTLLAEHPAALLLLDCEGAEAELIAGAVPTALARATAIIECHEFVVAGVIDLLRGRLSASHAVSVVGEGPRDPNRFAPLRSLPSLDRWLVVSENRPVSMAWLLARPRI